MQTTRIAAVSSNLAVGNGRAERPKSGLAGTFVPPDCGTYDDFEMPVSPVMLCNPRKKRAEKVLKPTLRSRRPKPRAKTENQMVARNIGRSWCRLYCEAVVGVRSVRLLDHRSCGGGVQLDGDLEPW